MHFIVDCLPVCVAIKIMLYPVSFMQIAGKLKTSHNEKGLVGLFIKSLQH